MSDNLCGVKYAGPGSARKEEADNMIGAWTK